MLPSTSPTPRRLWNDGRIPSLDEPCVLCGRTGEPLDWSLVWPKGRPCNLGWRCVDRKRCREAVR